MLFPNISHYCYSAEAESDATFDKHYQSIVDKALTPKEIQTKIDAMRNANPEIESFESIQLKEDVDKFLADVPDIWPEPATSDLFEDEYPDLLD